MRELSSASSTCACELIPNSTITSVRNCWEEPLRVGLVMPEVSTGGGLAGVSRVSSALPATACDSTAM